MPYAALNGQRVHYADSGGDGPVVVFSHGFLMDHEMWEPQVEHLRAEYRCIAWDERCFGQTETTRDSFDYWDLADDLIGLLDYLEIDRAVLCGMSQGGFISLRATLSNPDRVQGLVLVDTSPYAEKAETRALYEAMFAGVVADGFGDDLTAAVTAVLFGPGFDARYWVGKTRARPAVAMEPAMRCLCDRDDVSERLGEIECPTLVVHGELDASFPMDEVDAWARQLAAMTQLLKVPDAGHTANLENPGVVNSAIAEFLTAL